MEQSLASKIEQADLDIAIAAVNAQIEGIQQGLGQLISDNTAKIVENANDIKDAKATPHNRREAPARIPRTHSGLPPQPIQGKYRNLNPHMSLYVKMHYCN